VPSQKSYEGFHRFNFIIDTSRLIVLVRLSGTTASSVRRRDNRPSRTRTRPSPTSCEDPLPCPSTRLLAVSYWAPKSVAARTSRAVETLRRTSKEREPTRITLPPSETVWSMIITRELGNGKKWQDTTGNLVKKSSQNRKV
jgi:hypothetical protein